MKNRIIDDIKKNYLEKPDVIKALYLFCFFTSVFIFSPLANIALDLKPRINDFSNHIMSNAALNDFDVSSRIKIYFLIFLIIIGFSVVEFILFFKYIATKYVENEKNKKTIQTVFNLSLIGIAAVFTSFFVVNVDVALFFLLGLGISLLISTTTNKSYWDLENAFWLLTITIPFSLVVYKIVQNRIPPEKYESLLIIKGANFPLYTLGLLFCLIALVVSIFLLVFVKWFFRENLSEENYLKKRNTLYYATIPISIIVIAQCLLLEFFNVLNLKYNYLFNSPRLLFVIVSVIAVIISICIYYIKIKKDYKSKKNNLLGKYHFPLLIIGIGMMIAQPWRIFQPENEFFEFANHGISVDHFFRYGSIPIIENYDAHMLSGQLFAYLYGFISGYEPWAPFLYYGFIDVIYLIIIYLVFKKILGSKTAMLLLLCFPILGLVLNSFTMLCLVALTLNNVINKHSRKSFYWFWTSILVTCLFRLDLGFAAFVGGIMGYFSINYLLKKNIPLKRMIITGLISFGTALLLFIILCIVKGVNPIKRLQEFLIISSSNQNWAYKEMGDTSDVAFRICYYMLPLLLVLLLLNVIFKTWISKRYVGQIINSNINQAAFVFFIYFSTAYFFNIPRGIVRHSYAENLLTIVISCMPIALLCFIYIKNRKNNLFFFLLTFIGMYLLMGLNIKSFKNKETSLFSRGLYSVPFQEKFTDSYSFNKSRVKVTFNMSEINQLKKVLDAVLKPNETYFDFSSINYYYALVGRKNPVYINQSPLLLNGDVSQQMALDEIKEANVSLILMPNKNTKWKTIDMVDTVFKYYLISEYIYQNYTPITNMNSFDIYVRKDKKHQYESILKSKLVSKNNLQLDDFGGVDLTKLQQHNTTTELNADKSLLIRSTGDDPFMTGLLNQIDGFDLLNKDLPVKIKFKVNASTLGTLQVFYQLAGSEGFDEKNSKIFIFDNPGENNLELELPSCPLDIRIDLETPDISIKQIELVVTSGGDTEMPLTKNINLGEIPRVWAERSDERSFKMIPNLDEVQKESSISMSINSGKVKTKPYYLFVEMETKDIQTVGVELLDVNNQQKAVYYFNSSAGKHQYAIRLSADYYWWNDTITKVSLSAPAAVSISKFAMVSADGKNIESYKAGALTLSNITDQNWIGGIGIGNQSNLLLINNSKRNNDELNKGNYIELTDGSRIKIENREISGDFIRISVSQNIEALKLKLQYPNNLKIVK